MCIHSYLHIITCLCAYFSPEQPQSITVSVRPANNFPLDIYLLIDLSFSMNDDLQNLRRLSSELGMFHFKIQTLAQ